MYSVNVFLYVCTCMFVCYTYVNVRCVVLKCISNVALTGNSGEANKFQDSPFFMGEGGGRWEFCIFTDAS